MKILLYLVLIFTTAKLQAQDVSAFANKSNYGIGGNIMLSSNFYQSIGEQNNRFAPFGYMISGGIYGKIGAVSIPLNFSLNHLQGSISSPFNMIGASPYYKWAKIHLGTRSLNFSPYVYRGRAFNGFGIELRPGKFQFTAFTGKMKNLFAVQDTVVGGSLVLPTYDRNIQGMKIGYGSRANYIELMGIRVKDQDLLNSEGLFGVPLENFVFGLRAGFRLWKRFYLETNVAGSIFTSDQREREPEELSRIEESFEFLHDPNASSRYAFAGDLSLGYRYRGFSLGLKYRRIDPYFHSLGINYLQNDVENYTVDLAAPLLKQKLRIKGSLGWQSDNLYNFKAATSKRFIGSFSIMANPSKKLQLFARYSNFQNQNQSGLVAVNDTIRILTTTHNASLSGNLDILSNESRQGTLSFNIFRSQVVDESLTGPSNREFSGIGSNVTFTYTYHPVGIFGGPTFNYNNYQFKLFSQGMVGAGFTIGKSFFEKSWNNSLSFTLNQNLYDKKGNGSLLNIGFRSTYKVSEATTLRLRVNYVDNQRIVLDNTKEVRGSLAVGWRFR